MLLLFIKMFISALPPGQPAKGWPRLAQLAELFVIIFLCVACLVIKVYYWPVPRDGTPRQSDDDILLALKGIKNPGSP